MFDRNMFRAKVIEKGYTLDIIAKLKLKNIVGDVRVRGGSLIVVNLNLGGYKCKKLHDGGECKAYF